MGFLVSDLHGPRPLPHSNRLHATGYMYELNLVLGPVVCSGGEARSLETDADLDTSRPSALDNARSSPLRSRPVVPRMVLQLPRSPCFLDVDPCRSVHACPCFARSGLITLLLLHGATATTGKLPWGRTFPCHHLSAMHLLFAQ